MPDLLLELFSEEIPARMQGRAADDLRRLVTDGLVERGLTCAHAAAFATPRRLTLAIEGLSDASPRLREERKGPRADAPEKAIEGFLRATGLPREALETRADRKGDILVAVLDRPGRPAAEIVAETVEATVRAFPWPKAMRWGAGPLRWVRPLHSILCILTTEAGAAIVPFEIDGVASGDTTRGHRFHAPGAFAVTSFDDYRAKLARAFVLLDPAERAAKIDHDARQLAFANGLELVEDKGLLAENAGLTEWPVVLLGRIEDRFLDLPPEVATTSMRENQKFFSLRDAAGRTTAYLIVANRETADHGATIAAGNARLLTARLADAEFFWQNDLRTPLTEMAARLDTVTFHNRLGTQGQRVARIAALARELAPAVGADPDLAERAARLAKADLVSQMVYEFPELQGTMGRYYAERAGEAPEVAAAAPGHYAPLGPADAVPTAPVSIAVALADKLDTLTGFWAIDEKPTGSKDPFALRRAALGLVRTVLESGGRFSLSDIAFEAMKRVMPNAMHARSIEHLQELPGPKVDVPIDVLMRRGSFELVGGALPYNEWRALVGDLLAFLHDRLKVHLRAEGIRHDVIDAALPMPGNDDLVLLVARVRALQSFLATEDGANLVAGFRRAANILAQEEKKDGVEYSLDPDPRYAETLEEGALFAALDAAERALAPALAAEDFAAAMTVLARLREPIDAFFETTVVNADSPTIRRNRLCLLNRIRTVMNRVAAFSALEG